MIGEEPLMLEAKSLAEILAEPEPKDPVRFPVRNREPRIPFSAFKHHMIRERDGGKCWLCSRPAVNSVLDHLIPRSSFMATELHIADRSDNLHTACWNCNENRSNFDVEGKPTPIGVVVACWDCQHSDDDHRPLMVAPAYCARCGHTWIHDVRWFI